MTEDQYQLVLKACRIAQSQGIEIVKGNFGVWRNEKGNYRALDTHRCCAIGALVLGESTPACSPYASATRVAMRLLNANEVQINSFIMGFDDNHAACDPDINSPRWMGAGARMRAELGLDQPTTKLEPSTPQPNA